MRGRWTARVTREAWPRFGAEPWCTLALAALLLTACRPAVGVSSPHPPAASPPSNLHALHAGEIPDAVLRATIGIASVAVGRRPGGPEDEVPVYMRHGARLEPSGRMRLDGTQPVTVWQTGSDAVDPAIQPTIERRYPIVARRGECALIVLDPHRKRLAWLRRTADGSFPDSVRFIDFDDPATYRYEQVDLSYLAAAGERRLFEKPDRLSPSRPLGDGELQDADLVPLRREGDFLQVAAVRGLNDPRTAIGWLELRDESGRLRLWLDPAPDL